MHDPTPDPDATTERLAFAEATGGADWIDPPSPPIDPPLAETLAATPEPIDDPPLGSDLEQLASAPNVTVTRIKYRRFVATARSR